MSISNQEQKIKVIQTEINQLQPHCDGTHDCPNGVFCGSINFSACGRIYTLKSAMREEGRKLAELTRAKASREANEIEEERLLQIQLENQRVQNEIKRKQIMPKITPEILPGIVATSSLIPLGIIAILLLNSSRDKK